MSDYPDPEEEYELMYADEIDLLRENDENDDSNIIRRPNTAKRSLDFTSLPSQKHTQAQHKTFTDTQEPINILSQNSNFEETTTNNKRTSEDLFGDINDIDFEEQPLKKQKTDDEKDEELIQKILEGRRLRQLVLQPTGIAPVKSCYSVNDNISLNIPRWNFMAVTNSTGERYYVKLESEESFDSSINSIDMQTSFLKEESKTWEEARNILESKKSLSQQELQSQLQTVESEQTKLWVDKYKPQAYVDLLSDEAVNRALLHWLHLWDKIVFKKEVKVRSPQKQTGFVKRTGQFQLIDRWKSKPVDETQPDGTPTHKVALLTGPPGVGKTTLAHLLARAAGYRPVELNASDERSVESFRSALLSATQMRSVIDKEKRPNCLILDEIDGAPLPTVELLVKWCTATSAEASKKKSKVHQLKRPVIAICNNLYATALRPLRQISLIIRISPTIPRRLVSRLNAICCSEGLTPKLAALNALANKVDGDIRSAVLVLAFVAAKGNKEIKLEDIKKASVGEKDTNKNLMQALNKVFTINDDPDPFKSVLNFVSSAGEYDRLTEAIYENYLTSRVDARLISACGTMDNLITFDVINTWIQTRQNYSLYSMLPVCLAKCYTVLATRGNHKMKYPTVGQEKYRKKQELDSIFHSVYRGMSPSISTNRNALLLDMIFLLPYILSPTLRSNNVQLCTELERKSLESASMTMCDFGLQYSQQRTEDGTYAFVMMPDINKLAFFGNEDRLRVPPVVKQAIAREQQLESIRRCEIQTGKVDVKRDTVKMTEKVNEKLEQVALPNHLQTLQPKISEKSTTPQVQKDFFGRVVPIIECSQRSGAPKDLIASSEVFYQYQEGFNNAVRRSVKMKDLF